jgi:hypothetical protein
VSSSLKGEAAWPPKHRCENCGWWQRMKRGWFLRLLNAEQGHGWCKAPGNNDFTWKSFVCGRHTAAAYENVNGSLRTLANQQAILVDQLRKKR